MLNEIKYIQKFMVPPPAVPRLYNAFRKLMATDLELHDITRRAFKAGRVFAKQDTHPSDERDHTIA